MSGLRQNNKKKLEEMIIFSYVKYISFCCGLAAVLSFFSPANLSGSENAVYVWNRNWTPGIKESMAELRDYVNHYVVLCGELKYSHNNWKAASVKLKGAYFKEGMKVTLAVRVPEAANKPFSEGAFKDFAVLLGEVVDGAAKEVAQTGTAIEGLQIDYDCPTSKLNDYARLLTEIRRKFPDRKLSITALPTWLKSDSFKSLVAKTDYYILQLHAFEVPKNPKHEGAIFLGPKAPVYVKAADAINHPFFISLPTYGYEILYSESGQFVGLHAEGPSYYPPYVSRRKIVTTKPDEILSFLNWLDGNKVANLTGICWFRLPVDSDEFNWSVDSLKAVIQRRKPALSFSVRHEYRDKNLVEVYLTNNGEQNTEKSVYFSIAWKGHGPAIHDVFGKYRELERSGNEETEIVGPAPKTGHEIMVGWFRFDNFKNDKPSFEISRVEFYEKN